MSSLRKLTAIWLFASACVALGQNLPEGRLMRFPDVHGDKIVFSYGGDLWLVPTAGGVARRITSHPGLELFPKFSPDGKWIAFTGQYDGNFNVYVLPADGGEPRQLTDEPLGVEAFKFARRANRMLLFAPVLPGVEHAKQREAAAERAKKGPGARRYRRQPVRHWDHWLHDDPDRASTHLIACRADGSERVDLTPEATREFAIEPTLDLSEDGSAAVASWASLGADREDDSAVLWVELATRARRVLGAAPRTNNEHPLLAPDGRTLAVVRTTRSAQHAPRPLLTLIDVASGTSRPLAAQWDRWPQLGAWSADGRSLLVTADDEGQVPVYSIDQGSGQVERLSAPQAGGSYGNVVTLGGGSRIACIGSTLLDAPETYLLDIRACSAPRPLARLSGFVPAGDWAEVEHMRVTSDDGAPIHCLITRPRNAKHAPTLLWIHGGPIGMSGDGWHWRWNPLLAVAQGYTVAQPNPRGSTGFGQASVEGIWGNVWGEQCYRDLMAVTDALAQRAEVDPQRIMAMGGSFGGYMTNWIGTQTQRFKCLVTHASVFTMAQFTGTTDHPAWWYLEMGGEDPYADARNFDRYAPVRHIKGWKTPTLVIHGELDYRCPIGEALNLFEALQYHGVPSELLVFPDENHWILKPRNIVAWYEAVLEFIARHLRN